VIEFGDSYEAPQQESTTASASEGSVKKKGRTVTYTTDDMQKRRNDVKERTTLLLALLDEHQLRFKGLETLEQTFNRLQAIVSHLEFMDIEIEQDDLNQKFLTSLALEWLMHTIVWRNRSDLDTMTKNSSGNEEVNIASIPTASTQVSPASSNVATASISLDTACAYIACQSNRSQIKYEDINQIEEYDIEEMNIKWSALTATRWATLLGSAGLTGVKTGEGETTTDKEENHALVTDEESPTEFTLMAKSSSNNETGLLEFADDTITDYSRPSPAIESNSDDFQNIKPSVAETGASSSTILSKPAIKFMKSTDRSTESKTDKVETAKKLAVKYAELYRKTSKSPNVRGNQRNWNNLKSHQLGKNFEIKNKAGFNCGDFNHLSYDCGKWVEIGKPRTKYNTHKSIPPRTVFHKTVRPPMRTNRPNIGCSRHMTSNISYLSDYEPFDGGYVSFGQGGCKITGKGKIKTGKLEFENVYFMKDLKYNLFSVSQICDNKNIVLFTDSECIVLRQNFKLTDDTNVLLRTSRQHNMYLIDLNNVFPHKDLPGTVAKAFADECMLWHRRLSHLNIKTMNRLVRHNLVRGLPSKCFNNDHTCVACLKGKHHKASCKTKLVNSVTKPLHTLHMDLFRPTSVSSLNHKWYCLVVTDDFSRFTWTFFLKTKDETSGILRNFITEIENLKDLKIKIIRCDNRGEFRNKEMNDFCLRNGIKREFSNARTL
nr:putative ribonuclease H-like domain-containing protein [Tanacetum cinerariifolium]